MSSRPGHPTTGELAPADAPGRGAIVLAAAIPPLFLHATYQPTVHLGLGGADLDLTLADVAIAAVVTAALIEARGAGLAPLRRARWILAAGAAFVAFAWLSLLLPYLRDQDFPFLLRTVSVGKFTWYALLAPATLYLIRRPPDLRLLGRAVVVWSVVATSWGLLQFAGVVDEFEGKRPGQREPSFIGIHDFAALSGAALTLGLIGLAYTDGKPLGHAWRWPALVTGALGIVLSGAMTAVIGLWLATVAIVLLAHRARALRVRALALATLVAVLVTLGTALMRADTLTHFAEFLGLRDETDRSEVQSYAQRTLLGYIGLRIFLEHPVAGVGWNGSSDEFAFGPVLDEARARFPDEPDEAFPSAEHPWGVQNLYIQTLADLGVVGFASLLLLAGSAVVAALRRPDELQRVGLAWVLIVAGVWLGLGLVAGIPVLALTWIGLALCGADG